MSIGLDSSFPLVMNCHQGWVWWLLSSMYSGFAQELCSMEDFLAVTTFGFPLVLPGSLGIAQWVTLMWSAPVWETASHTDGGSSTCCVKYVVSTGWVNSPVHLWPPICQWLIGLSTPTGAWVVSPRAPSSNCTLTQCWQSIWVRLISTKWSAYIYTELVFSWCDLSWMGLFGAKSLKRSLEFGNASLGYKNKLNCSLVNG